MGLYIVRKDSWYAERTVWAIAGIVITTGTSLAWLVHPLYALLITTTGLFSLVTAFTGYCGVSTVLANLGFQSRLGSIRTTASGWRIYRMNTDKWFLERGIYLVVGTTQTVGSVLAMVHSPGWLFFTGFVGTMAVGFAGSGFCPVANVLYFLGFEPRLSPVEVNAQVPQAGASAPAR